MRSLFTVVLLGSLSVGVLINQVVAQNQKSADPKIADALVAKEKALLEALFNKKPEAVNSMLAEDSIYVGEDGFEAAKIDTSKPFDWQWTEYKPSDFKVVQPDANTALVMFKNWVKFKNGETADSYQTTLWVKRNGEWHNAYHADVHPYSPKKN